jgi:tetratricopeptide (TPR) repeat protein
MIPRIPNGGVDVPPHEIAEITRLYDLGLYVQACARATAAGPLHEWRGTAARLIAGRVANNVHAPRLGTWLHLRARRDDRTSAEAAYFYASDISRHRGPLAAWRFLRQLPAFPDATAETRADLLGLEARFASFYRDFETGAALLREAEALAPQRLWLWIEKSDLLEKQDAYDEALEIVQRALAVRPWYRPAVQSAAHLLQLIGRDDDALALLTEAQRHLESSYAATQLAALQTELGLHAEALATWTSVRVLAPLMEKESIEWWEARMSDAHYLCGDLAKAADCASRAKGGFFEKIAARLSAPAADGRRVVLPVEFVRQHHMTCAPATLSALSRFWQMPVDHLALAATICYDGTPDHVERDWAERNGWHVREFRVTWEISRALLDHGIPFTISTVETQSAHLQAIIGYDSFRGTLLVRDPYQRTTGEWLGEEFLADYAPNGPRGMVLVPADRAALLDGVALPDAEFYDPHYRLERALHVHDRPAAQQHFEEMERADAAHRLTLQARRQLAWYDSSLPRQLAVVEELLARHPKNGGFLWSKLIALRELARRDEFREFLRGLAAEKDSEVIFWREWAEELAQDARENFTAERLMLRALHVRPFDADNLRVLANLYWNRREFAEATWLYRLAACLRDKVEGFSRSYFIAARHQRRTDEAMTMLTGQFEKFAGQSVQPTRLLFWALTLLDRQPEAFAKLDAALALRPEDGELLLYAADAFARHGDPVRAATLLAAAEPRAASAAWLRAAASLADYRCDLHEALALWQRLLAEEPLALDAHRSTTRLLAETQGRPAALAHLRETCARFPHHVPLHRLWVDWAHGEGYAEVERVLRLLLALDPDDAWARRELALVLSSQRRFDEAHRELDAGEALDPHSPSTHAVRGRVLLNAGSQAAAREACRAALRLSIDEQSPLNDLMAASVTNEEKRAALAFVRGELVSQVVFGDGLLAFREAAFSLLDPPELLAALREAHAARPDLWHAWSAVVCQLSDMHQPDEALDLARQSTERFPLLPRVWLDLAQVHRARREREAEIPPLHRALQLAPAWGRASRLLADVHQRMGQYAEARRVLEQAIAAAPLDAYNHGCLADVLWHLGLKAECVAAVEHALRLEPGYEWAWDALRGWSPPDLAENRAVTLARELTQTRAGEARSWFVLAQSLGADALDERLAALDRCTELNPLYNDAHDTRAWLLAHAGRFDEAAAACAPAAFGDAIPFNLQGRAAWIEAQRGHLRAAIARMSEVVGRFPDYYWGWNMLTDWHCENRDFPKARETAKMMARLAPRSAIPLGYLADVQMKLGEKHDAWGTLRRAFEVDPTYRFAGDRLLDRHLEEGEFKEAEEIVTLMETHTPGAGTLLARLRLHCRRKEFDHALNILRKICVLPAHESFAVTGAVRAFEEAGWARSAEDLFRNTVDDPSANPEIGACWVRLFITRDAWQYRKLLAKLDSKRELTRVARVAYIEALGETKRVGRLRRYIRRERATLCADLQTWGTVGYALLKIDKHADAVKWLSDWKQRPGTTPWMLLNLISSLRHLRRDAEALAVSRYAVTLKPDHTTQQHQLWIAFDAALRGDCPNSAAIVAEIREHDESAYIQALLALVNAICAVRMAPPTERRAVLKEQFRILDADPRSTSPHAPLLRHPVLSRARLQGIIVMCVSAQRIVLAWLYRVPLFLQRLG